MGIFILINNFLHDFAAGILLANILLSIFVKNEIFDKKLLFRILKKQLLISYFSLIVIVIGGFIRTVLYRYFEWVNEAGNLQIYILLAKHIILGGIALFGVYFQIRLKRKCEGSI